MKFTLSWLKDHLNTEKSLEEILENLTNIGLEVEKVKNYLKFNSFIVSRVLEIKEHPKSRIFKIISIDTGEKFPTQIITKSINIQKGFVCIFAKFGSYVPGMNITIQIKTIFGYKSYGIICSEKNLMLSDNDNIIILPKEIKIGTCFANYLNLDPIIEINLTPNRSDCANVYGIARDLSATKIGKLQKRNIPKILYNQEKSFIKVDFDFPKTENPLCSYFSLYMIRNLKNGSSPKWMQKRLIDVGCQPINAVIDISNYLMFDQGYPVHIFDADKIKGYLKVRTAFPEEKFFSWENKEYKLSSRDCIISDEENIISVSGIIGSKKTACDQNTRNIFLESSLWNSENITRTGRSLCINSESRYRFERGVDSKFMFSNICYAIDMIINTCNGTSEKIITKNFRKILRSQIRLSLSKIQRLTGFNIPKNEVYSILKLLGFKIKIQENQIFVVIPSWRNDIFQEEDLIEEIVRIYGFQKIKPKSLRISYKKKITTVDSYQYYNDIFRKILSCRGMLEIINWSFISMKAAKIFGGGDESLRLKNPISIDMSDMKPSLLPGLIVTAQKNINRGFSNLALFEVSNVYKSNNQKEQYQVVSGIRSGTERFYSSGRFWSHDNSSVNVFDAKEDALSLLNFFNFSFFEIKTEKLAPKWYCPGRSGVIILQNKFVVCHFGEFHPQIIKFFNIKHPICGFELFLDEIPLQKRKKTKFFDISNFQKLTRDFSFIVDKNVSSENVIHTIYNCNEKLIKSVKLFDVFENKNLGHNKKSLSLEVEIHPYEKTLNEEEIEKISKIIINNVFKNHNGILRKEFSCISRDC